MRSPSLHAGPTIPARALDDLRRRAAGPLRTCSGAAVLRVADAEDVATAVRWAVAECAQVVDQPPVDDRDERSGALLLDLVGLDHVRVDVERRVAHVGAGVAVGDLATALAGTGLTFPGVPDPAARVARAALAGGLGWFGRSLGLACDDVVGADVVDGLGRVRRVDAERDQDLFWALRGGSPGLGVVVGLEFALHPAPLVQVGRLTWEDADVEDVLAAFRDACARSPDRSTARFEVLRGSGHHACVSVVSLDPAATDEVLAPLRAVPGLVGDDVVEATAETVLTSPPGCASVPAGVHGTLVDGLDDPLLARVAAATRPVRERQPWARSPVPRGVRVHQLGGALRRPTPGAGCHGPVTEPYVVWPEGLATGAPGRTGRILPEDHGVGEGTWFDAATRARLTAVKQEVDPIDTICGFRHHL